MIYTGDLVKINGTRLPYITSYKIERAKLWKNSERNMAGDIRATLVGVFPKIIVSVGYTTQEQMANITALLDQDFFTVEWFDVRIQETVSTKYYASDYTIELDNKYKGRYKPFEVSLVPVSKRRY